MAISRAERTDYVNKLLNGLLLLRGVTAASIVDEDGLVSFIRYDFQVDTDALGVAVQVIFGSAMRAAQHVEQGDCKIILSENKEGMVLLAPLIKGLILTVIADETAMLGAVRFELKETIPMLNEVFS